MVEPLEVSEPSSDEHVEPSSEEDDAGERALS